MTSHLTTALSRLLSSYVFVMSTALIAGLFFPKELSIFSPFTTLFLQIIFFFTSLKLNVREVLVEIKDVRVLALVNFLKLILFPIVVFFVAEWLFPSMAVPLLLLAAMPGGMTSPLLVEVVGGNQSLALVITITESLLAPFTIPLIMSQLAGAAITVSAFAMFTKLVSVIIVPFFLAQLIRLFWHKHIAHTFFTFKPISIALLALLIAGAVAQQATVILSKLNVETLMSALALFAFILIFFIAGYYLIFWRKAADRLSIAVCTAFINFTLAIYLANEFFADPHILLAAILIIFPWTLFLLPLKRFVERFVHL